MNFRTFVERLVRGRTLRRRLPNGVPLYVSPDAQLKYLKGHFDDDLVELANTHVSDGDTVWDIGANCGVFAFSCNRAARVVAVEADPFLGNLLRRSVDMNGANVAVLNCALSSSCGVASFTIAQRGRASNHLSEFTGSTQGGGERFRLTVPTLTLDTLLDAGEPPAMIKIDVEGAEVAVLRGGERVLRDARPILWIETTHRTHQDCRTVLEEHGYEMEQGIGENWLCRPRTR
ncbi:FkbM family methyltransferase [Aurantiacibacter luteus]|uniref:FkbM family methyltransferase n=1 Tax=Aurantiacibacter luteus TaxID=1581420 RepID=UPI000AA93009|nr:FkbM family methyltransferase [Aurantiacibacter luteus]